ncbi:unnamed protein product [Rotaria socialis]|uniref:Uncharacterized protein n=2 Tax=Rotaria socialis TaxID=392032 RepID=A0A821KTU3_9BILA|nr:unnamed protein product [Rotaria socialis]
MIPFLSYHILPTQAIVRNNIHIGHVKEDIECLLMTLGPILYIFHQDIPKPHLLHPNIIQNLAIKPETSKLLPLLGWLPNNAGEYCYCDTESPQEIECRKEAAREFRKFYNELATAKNKHPNQLENFLSIRIAVPFSSYSILPAKSIVQANVRIGHVKEDIESFLRPLVPLLYISKPEIPKPAFLHWHIIQKIAMKPGTLQLLELFGYCPNGKGDYLLVDAKSTQELMERAQAASEFRRFYDELKKIKDDPVGVLEYCLSHPKSAATATDLCF